MSDAAECRRPRRRRARFLELTRHGAFNTAHSILTTNRVPRSLVSLTVASILMAAPAAYAQGQFLGAVRGTVTDEQGGLLPGVAITAIPADKRPAPSTTTDAGGFYKLTDLLPGSYDIKAELSGFTTLVQPGVIARAGVSLALNLVLTVGGMNETVTIRRDPPLLESSSATTAVNISGDLQRALPTSQRRNWSDALILTPGVVSADSNIGGITQNYLVHGSNFSSHVLQIDGADLASATSSQPFYIAFSNDLIADVQVKTAGVDASAPLGTGAVMNVATKSGTNDLSGSVAMTYQGERWNDTNVPGGTSPQVGLVQPDVSAGGPVVRDRAWFFGAYRRTDATAGISRTPEQVGILSTLDPSFRPFDLTTAANLFFSKITANLSSPHRVSAFYQSDSTKTDSGGAQDALPSTDEIGGHAVAGRLSSTWGASATSELSVSYNDKNFATPEIVASSPYQFAYHTVVSSGGLLQGVDPVAHVGAPNPTWTKQPANKLTVSYDVSYVIDRAIGTHEIKAGTFLQPRTLNESNVYYVNGGHALEQLVLRDAANPAAGLIPFQRSVWPESAPQYRSLGSDVALYVQDVWRVNRLTATLGLRIDRVQYRDTVFDVTTQKSVDLGPRLGLNCALRSDGRSVARFTWSRIADRVAGAAFAGTVTPTQTDFYDLDLDGSFETTNVIPGSSSLSRSRIFDPGLHQPYVHEVTAGYRQQFPRQVSLDVGIVRRLMRDRFTAVEINGIYDDGVFRGYRDESQNDIYRLTNNGWNWPVYTALELSAAKRTNRVEAIASYTRQWQHIAGGWQPNDPGSFIQPDAFPNNRGIGSPSGSLSSPAQANSLSGSSMALSAQSASPWQDHIVRTGMTVLLPWNLMVAGNYTFQSGPWSGPVVQRISSPDPAFGPPTVVLSNGRMVSNPLATVVRFAYPTRGEGQFHLAGLHVLNMRLTKLITFGRGRFAIAADLFNVTNSGTDQGLVSGGNVLGSANFRLGQNRQVPRGAQLSARVTF